MKIDSIKIAELAGVSRSTVSRVLNNHPNVSKKNRDKILKIIDEYNYIPNLNAQTLAGKKNKVIGPKFKICLFSKYIKPDKMINVQI